MKLTIYTITYNEEFLFEFFINHYRQRFPRCKFIIYDNASTDKTVQLAQENGCEVIDYSYQSNGQLNDGLHCSIKNNCWKSSETDFVIVSDLDELIDLNAEQLQKEQDLGTTRIRTEGWQMVNMLEDNYDVADMKWGSRSDRYDKFVCFNKNYIKEMNYTAGAHTCNSIGNIIDSKEIYKLYHYKFINTKMLIEKSKATRERLSETNKRNGWGLAQVSRMEQAIIDEFMDERKKAVKVRE